MLNLYRLSGLLYLLSGLWCAFQLELVAAFLGFSLATPAAKAEFFSVYGGLQVGLGIAMLFSSFKPQYLEASLVYSAIFSTGLCVFRLLSFVLFGFVEAFVAMLILELVIMTLLWLAVWRIRSKAEV